MFCILYIYVYVNSLKFVFLNICVTCPSSWCTYSGLPRSVCTGSSGEREALSKVTSFECNQAVAAISCLVLAPHHQELNNLLSEVNIPYHRREGGTGEMGRSGTLDFSQLSDGEQSNILGFLCVCRIESFPWCINVNDFVILRKNHCCIQHKTQDPTLRAEEEPSSCFANHISLHWILPCLSKI